MIDKIETKLYTDIGAVTILKECINNVPTLTVSLNDKIEFIIKQLVSKSNDLENAVAIIYYDNETDLSKYIYTNNIEDAYKIKNKEIDCDNIKIVILPYNIENNDMNYFFSNDLNELLEFIKLDAKGRTDKLNELKMLFEIGEYNPLKEVKKVSEVIFNTVVGKLTFQKNNENFPNGLTIKLNNAPIILLEETEDNTGENKLVLKRYPNKNIINNDDYFNMISYDIDISKIAKETVDEILKDIEN